MAESTHEDEVSRLKARIEELEAELKEKRGSRSERKRDRSRAADTWADVQTNKGEVVTRLARGLTLGSLEGVRLFADVVSSFADGVGGRNSRRDDGSTTPQRLASRLPTDMIEEFSDAFDRFVDIPARAAERYAEAYREGTARERKSKDASESESKGYEKPLADYTVAELTEIADREGAEIKSGDTKAQIIAAIKARRR
jgi:cell division septum initiation protein DivIVA